MKELIEILSEIRDIMKEELEVQKATSEGLAENVSLQNEVMKKQSEYTDLVTKEHKEKLKIKTN